jgi:hypothetical protein
VNGNDSLNISNVPSGYYVIEAEIGTDLGLTSVIFDSKTVPDRFLIYYDGVVVADSLFVGDGLINNPGQYKPIILATTSLTRYIWNGNQFVIDGNNPTQSVNFTDDDFPNCSDDRVNANTGNQIGVNTEYPSSTASNCDGNVRIEFIKTQATPTTIEIVVIGCDNGTRWDLDELICPEGNITPTPTPSITPSSVTPTVTPSITPTISVTPSITPTISVTPSITPSSVTPSVTPTISITPSITPTF